MINPKTGKRWKVYLAVPSMGEVHDFLPFMMRDWQERYKDEIEFIYPTRLTQRIFHDYARNGTVEDFLESDAEILWSIDSDVVPPKHAPDLITMHGDTWEAAGCPYPVFMCEPGQNERKIVFTAYKTNSSGSLVPAPVPHSGTEFIDGLATGCLMLKRELIERLEKPYFEFQFNPESRQPTIGEDLGFCLKLSKLGVKFFTDYSMVCKHQKKVDLLEMNNYCMQFANQSVLNYDAMIRAQVEALEAYVRKIQAEKKAPKSSLISLR